MSEFKAGNDVSDVSVLWYPKNWRRILREPYSLLLSSNRMRVYNLHECIKETTGVRSEVAGYTTLEPDPFSFDVVVFQKHFDAKLATMLHKRGVTVVFDICDPYQLYRNIHKFGDLLTTNSFELAEYFRAQNGMIPIVVLEEPYEGDPGARRQHEKTDRVAVTWYGSPANYEAFVKPLTAKLLPQLDFVDFRWAGPDRPECHADPHFEPGIELHMDWREAWKAPHSWLEFIHRSDVGLVPVPPDQIKPRHKVLSYMAYGVPVVCSPIDAYRRIVRHGENGFFAETPDEWRRAVEVLRDPNVRNRIGARAKQDVADEDVVSLANDYWRVVTDHRRQETAEPNLATRLLCNHRVYGLMELLRGMKNTNTRSRSAG